MRNELNSLTKKLNQLQGQRDLLIKQQEDAEKNNIYFQEIHDNTLRARIIVQKVAEDTQKQIEYHISNLVTMALSSVFPDPYEFKLRFIQKRNKTEAELLFIKRGNEVDDILENGGGGVADVASFALRIALWSIRKTRPTIILDEPFKFLHNPTFQRKTSEMLKEISKKLGIQLIVVSDQENIISAADKVIEIVNVDGISVVKDEKYLNANTNKTKLQRRKEVK